MHIGFSMRAAAVACAAVSGIVALAPSAGAAIACNGEFQDVAGSEISTPYCRDTNLARLARRSGMRVSDHEVLYNPSTKGEVCRFLGHNIEARSACPDSSGGRDGSRH